MKRKIDLESLPLKNWKKEATMFQDDYTAGAGTSWLLNVAKAENKMIWEMIRAIEEAPAITPPNEPLTLEELREMEAPTPVWWGRMDIWCLCERGFITTPNGNIYAVEETSGDFYRRPPEAEADGE